MSQSVSVNQTGINQTISIGLRRQKFKSVARLIKRYPVGFIGFCFVLFIVLVALFAPAIAPHDPLATDILRRVQPPSVEHPFGTDQLGRDVMSRVIFGARISLTVGVISVLIGAIIGSALGITASFGGGFLETMIMRLTDILMAFPTILLAIIIVAFFGTSIINVIIAIAITRIPTFIRVTHGMTLSLKETEFVEAARASGATGARIGFHHILPNTMSAIVVMATLEISVAILIEASLGFLGLSVQPPTPTWGSIIQEGRAALERAPWLANSAGLCVFLLIMAVNLMGDSLRDFLNPRSRKVGK